MTNLLQVIEGSQEETLWSRLTLSWALLQNFTNLNSLTTYDLGTAVHAPLLPLEIYENQTWKSQTLREILKTFVKDLEVKNNALKVVEENIKAYQCFLS